MQPNIKMIMQLMNLKLFRKACVVQSWKKADTRTFAVVLILQLTHCVADGHNEGKSENDDGSHVGWLGRIKIVL